MLSLSEASHGNALGVGLVSARIPCVLATDKEAIQICIRTCTGIDKEKVRVIRIPKSLHIDPSCCQKSTTTMWPEGNIRVFEPSMNPDT